MTRARKPSPGFTLIELMIAMTLGLFLLTAVIGVYLAQTRSLKSSSSQASIQNAENAIAALVTPTIRSAGYAGCTTLATSAYNLVPGGSPPLGSLTSPPTLPAKAGFLVGYEAVGSGPTGTITIAQINSANDPTASHWAPSLDPLLAGTTQTGSDVVAMLGPLPGVSPVNVTSMVDGSVSFTIQDLSATGIVPGQFGVVSTCADSVVFKTTAVSTSDGTITHAASGGVLNNVSDSLLNLHYLNGSHFLPLQQTAFFVAHGQGDQSTLMRATYDGSNWTAQPLVPGVDSMQVLYGLHTNSNTTEQYVTANAVVDWTAVFAIRIGFLVTGQLGSGGAAGTTLQQFSVLGTKVKVPSDGRLRHVFEMNIKLRNAA
jgi:type IV pilus assembly protein PilW